MASGRIVITLSVSAPGSSAGELNRAGQAAVHKLMVNAWAVTGALKALAPIKLPNMAMDVKGEWKADVSPSDPLGIVPGG